MEGLLYLLVNVWLSSSTSNVGFIVKFVDYINHYMLEILS